MSEDKIEALIQKYWNYIVAILGVFAIIVLIWTYWKYRKKKEESR